MTNVNGGPEITEIRISRLRHVEYRAGLAIESAVPEELIGPIAGENHDIGLHSALTQAAGMALIVTGGNVLAQGQRCVLLQLLERRG
ncbi:hypothetical protein D3C76_1671460 [compost metagenome]